MKNITVLSRKQFEEFIPCGNTIAISITDPNSEPVEYVGDYKAILHLEFYDLDKDTGQFPYSRFVFTKRNAEQILDFVDSFKDSIDSIAIHCEAGVSRSAGVAGALANILNGDDRFYFLSYIPNMRVYSTILDTYYND